MSSGDEDEMNEFDLALQAGEMVAENQDTSALAEGMLEQVDLDELDLPTLAE